MEIKTNKNIFKTIEIPHLEFTVHFMDLKYLKGEDRKGSGFTCISGEQEATVFLENIEKTVKSLDHMPYVAHELMHVIQIICETYNMTIEHEQEHTAYLMYYLMDCLTIKSTKKVWK